MSGHGRTRGVPIGCLAVFLALLSVIAGIAVVARALDCAQQTRVHTLSELRAHLTDGPASWVGREVLVRAVVEPCPWWGDATRRRGCADRDLVLMGVGAEVGGPLPLERAAPLELLVTARRLPLLGRLLPPPRPLPLFTPERFRVQLRALPPGACGRTTCYEAVVLDAAP